MMRKVIVYIAQSLDGFIAKPDGDILWLSIVEKEGEDYGYNAFIESVDTVFMGRKTYEKVLSFGIEFPHKGRKCYVLTSQQRDSDENVTFFNGDLKGLVDELKKQEGGHIFIDGGAETVRAFRALDLVDEYVISIIPVLLGSGIRLFKEVETENLLKLTNSRVYDSGLVQLKYTR